MRLGFYKYKLAALIKEGDCCSIALPRVQTMIKFSLTTFEIRLFEALQ